MWLVRDRATAARVHWEGGKGCPIICVRRGYPGALTSVGDHRDKLLGFPLELTGHLSRTRKKLRTTPY